MPQASVETLSRYVELLKEEIGTDGNHAIFQSCAIIILREHFKETKGVISLKDKKHYFDMTELERYAIKYLVEEWDYAWVDAE